MSNKRSETTSQIAFRANEASSKGQVDLHDYAVPEQYCPVTETVWTKSEYFSTTYKRVSSDHEPGVEAIYLGFKDVAKRNTIRAINQRIRAWYGK